MSDLAIEVRGTGPVPLVLIHGWAMHGGIFAPLADLLESAFTMYLVDLPGHGNSRNSGIPLEPRACADAIAAATPPAVWLGWSLGGLVALTAALERHEHVLGLTMLCSTPKFVRDDTWPYGNDASMVRQLAADLKTDYRATLERFIALEAMGSADPRAEARRLREETFARGEPDPRVLQEGIRLLETTDMRDRLPELVPASLWMAGHRDRLVHPSAMKWSANACGGDFNDIAHAGHAPFIGHADAMADALQSFIGALA
ncbi:carboxylesterase BioH (pimeloyl-CoA synthesis) [Luteibacter rhizovicinus]|uniref:Pimeloyl-[acyl-carrier protein] methyl ester esterase n=1 Tax=Luteibacter rhizovicinus TaxID=242606 RepID=A0A4R3YJZ6_9GAMM|nr:pimeloyl-ACP methyl ester esterase BioH [Luteibacter rhizovicinus]TCV92422.1 carboxylesterase BioH (pimeloyl-CoA synthesis) [Luteibacter rhizovicinus]